MKEPVIKGNTIIVPSSLEYLTNIDDFIEGILRGFGTDDSAIADIAISVSELVNNSVSHGNKASEDKTVSVSIDKKGSDVVIVIEDQGDGFDPEEISNPLDEANLLKDSGRGIFIVKSLMDSLEVNKTETGTSIIIKKAIA
ncbi:MAG: ATP-binding protein [Calditrichaeota bacterium]|nr:MAG: ATP-binding protein [Calditrichota bacterium]